jgi:hypothetical protein
MLRCGSSATRHKATGDSLIPDDVTRSLLSIRSADPVLPWLIASRQTRRTGAGIGQRRTGICRRASRA